jgi:hypothetical protein
MKWWTKILPYCFIEWYAKRNLQRVPITNEVVVIPYRGVYIKVEEDKKD